MPEPTVTLSQDQIDFYHAHGYLTIEAITTPEEIERLRAVYDRIFAERVGREEGNQFDLAGSDEEGKEASLPQILTPSRYAPELAESLYRANAAAIARQLLGDTGSFQGDHAIFKPAGHGASTPWHQDEAYWDPGHTYDTVNFWMPLQDVDEENGCMQFIPDSHKLEILPHRPINNDPRVHGLEIVPRTPEVDLNNAVACPLPAGGATLHKSRTLHYAGPNNSDRPRRAYILGFGNPPARLDEPRDFPWLRRQQTARQQRAKEFAEKQQTA